MTTRIAAATERFAAALCLFWDGRIIRGPAQRAVTFLAPSSEGETQVELIEPDSPLSPVARFVAKGGGVHHLCYEVGLIDWAMTRVRATLGIVVGDPTPAVAFSNRLIAWIYTRDPLLVELLERDRAKPAND